ncbi:helix-turn-helix domain-containing protein [Microvirga tunisiensis]|uniref:Helix-turn-helix domain-containing protein n=1 Tax=Pannonibacter tanglangensis TaxID=2750084 RepID=A0A7X5J861_9HYPH|nr:AraC family transcriptional regulator [Pannonibacter sp. XCT-53]NBN76875.1 helix-turn-helix domain-containing protein [Pannonibacter sp. XCT-53]
MSQTPDHFAETPAGHPGDALSPILEVIRLRGEGLSAFRPAPGFSFSFGPARGVLHVVGAGRIQLAAGPQERPLVLETGDVAVLIPADGHRIADDWALPPQAVAPGCALDLPQQDAGPGPGPDPNPGPNPDPAPADGHAAWFTGWFSFDPVLAKHLFSILPVPLVVRAGQIRPEGWLGRLVEMIALETAVARQGAHVATSRLLDLLIIQVLRSWAIASATEVGWLAAATDDRIGRALAAIHADPAHAWTVNELAALAGMSRTVFAERFAQLVGHTPASYIACWRLDHATGLLRTSDLTLSEIAFRSGFASAATFSRAFRQRFEATPQRWRQLNRGR